MTLSCSRACSVWLDEWCLVEPYLRSDGSRRQMFAKSMEILVDWDGCFDGYVTGIWQVLFICTLVAVLKSERWDPVRLF